VGRLDDALELLQVPDAPGRVVVGERRSEQRIQVVVAARVDRVADPPYEREVVGGYV